MTDVEALLAEQARLLPALERLLTLAANWADAPSPATQGIPAAGETLASPDAMGPAASTDPDPALAGWSGVARDAPAVPATRPPPRPDARGGGEAPDPTTGGLTIPRPSNATGAPRAARRRGQGSDSAAATVASLPTVATSQPPGDVMRLARLPAPRGRVPPTPSDQATRSPFAALAASAAREDPVEPGSTAPAMVMRAGVAAKGGPAASATFPAIAFAPATRMDPVPLPSAPASRAAAPGPTALGLFATAPAGVTMPAETSASWRDGLEDQLADLLERAAAEAGVMLP